MVPYVSGPDSVVEITQGTWWRGLVWLRHLIVNQEIAGSNPVVTAQYSRRVRAVAKAVSAYYSGFMSGIVHS